MAAPFDLSPEGFVWAVGIENTFIGQTERAGERLLDEYALTHHYQFWREDIDRCAALGVQALRYGLPWYKCEPDKGRFDWDWSDRVLDYAAEKGILVIADLMHYGVPLWLDNQFLNTDYENHVADWAAAFAERFKPLLHHYTPFNETLICSEFAGRDGIWPPYLRGDDGQVKLIRNIARGMTRSIEAIRAADGAAVIVQVDAAGEVEPDTPDLMPQAELETAKTFIGSDLVVGAVDDAHLLADWLLRHGMSADDLAWHRARPQILDVVGTNYYPQFSVQRLVMRDGRPARQAIDGGVVGLERSVRAFAERYGKPVMITETSLNGSVAERIDWLEAATGAVGRIRGQGVPLVGFTWFPVFDLIDWVYRAGRPVEEFITRRGPGRLDPDHVAEALRKAPIRSFDAVRPDDWMAPMGLYELRRGFDETFARIETDLVPLFREKVAANAVGTIGAGTGAPASGRTAR